MLYCINQHFHYSYFSVFSMPFCFYALRGSLWLYIILCIQTFWDIRQWLDFPLPSMKLDSFNKYVWKSHKLIAGPIACGFLWRKYSLFPHNSNRLFLLDLYFYNSIYIFLHFYADLGVISTGPKHWFDSFKYFTRRRICCLFNYHMQVSILILAFF